MFKIFCCRDDFVRTVVHYYMYAILGLMMSIPGPTLMDLQVSSHTNARDISFIYIARSSGYLLGSLTGGIVLDYLKIEEKALFVSSLTVALSGIVIPYSRCLSVLLVTFVIAGFSIGFSNTGCNASCLRIWGKKSTPVLQGLHLLYGMGGLVAPLLASPFLQEHLPSNNTSLVNQTEGINQEDQLKAVIPLPLNRFPTITYAYLTIGIMGIIVSMCYLLICIYIKPQKCSVKEVKVLDEKKQIYFTVVVVILACLLTGLSSGIEVSFTQMMTSYVVISNHGLSKSLGSYITSAYWGSFTVTRFLCIFLTVKVDIRKILIFVLALSVSGSVLLLTIGTWSVAAIWIGAIMLGVSMAPIFPGTLSWVEKYIDINNRIASVFTLVSCLLEMVVPFTIKIYLDTFPEILFSFLTGATLMASILFIVLNVILNRKGDKYEQSKEENV